MKPEKAIEQYLIKKGVTDRKRRGQLMIAFGLHDGFDFKGAQDPGNPVLHRYIQNRFTKFGSFVGIEIRK